MAEFIVAIELGSSKITGIAGKKMPQQDLRNKNSYQFREYKIRNIILNEYGRVHSSH